MKHTFFLLSILLLGVSFNLYAFPKNGSVYDAKGHKTGSYKTNSNGWTTSYDAQGHKTGSYKTNSDGSTTSYNARGHKRGSVR